MSDYPDGWFVPPELIKRRPQTKEDILQVEIKNLRARAEELEKDAADLCYLLRTRVAELEKDAARLDWIELNLIEGKWDGTLGRPKSWHMVGPYRHTLQAMSGNTLRESIDAAIAADAAGVGRDEA